MDAPEIVVGLDIGTTKIACLVGRKVDKARNGAPRLVGQAHGLLVEHPEVHAPSAAVDDEKLLKAKLLLEHVLEKEDGQARDGPGLVARVEVELLAAAGDEVGEKIVVGLVNVKDELPPMRTRVVLRLHGAPAQAAARDRARVDGANLRRPEPGHLQQRRAQLGRARRGDVALVVVAVRGKLALDQRVVLEREQPLHLLDRVEAAVVVVELGRGGRHAAAASQTLCPRQPQALACANPVEARSGLALGVGRRQCIFIRKSARVLRCRTAEQPRPDPGCRTLASGRS